MNPPKMLMATAAILFTTRIANGQGLPGVENGLDLNIPVFSQPLGIQPIPLTQQQPPPLPRNLATPIRSTKKPVSTPYEMGYDVLDGDGNTHGRKESGNAAGHKIGSYSMRLADGRIRIVDYIADDNGFRVSIRSNEAGYDPSQNPASVVRSPVPPPLRPIPEEDTIAPPLPLDRGPVPLFRRNRPGPRRTGRLPLAFLRALNTDGPFIGNEPVGLLPDFAFDSLDEVDVGASSLKNKFLGDRRRPRFGGFFGRRFFLR